MDICALFSILEVLGSNSAGICPIRARDFSSVRETPMAAALASELSFQECWHKNSLEVRDGVSLWRRRVIYLLSNLLVSHSRAKAEHDFLQPLMMKDQGTLGLGFLLCDTNPLGVSIRLSPIGPGEE